MHCFQKRKVDNKDLCIDLGQVGTPTVPSLRSANVLHQILDVVEIILASKCFKEFQIRTVRALFSFQFFPTFKTSSFIDGISVINPNLKTARMIEKVFSPFFTSLHFLKIRVFCFLWLHYSIWSAERQIDHEIQGSVYKNCSIALKISPSQSSTTTSLEMDSLIPPNNSLWKTSERAKRIWEWAQIASPFTRKVTSAPRPLSWFAGHFHQIQVPSDFRLPKDRWLGNKSTAWLNDENMLRIAKDRIVAWSVGTMMMPAHPLWRSWLSLWRSHLQAEGLPPWSWQ